MKKGMRFALYMILAMIVPVAVLLSSTLFYAYNGNYYLAEFEGYNAAGLVNVDGGALEAVVDNITGYLSGRVDTMDIQIEVGGKLTRFYNDKELTHMVDVKRLMDAGGRLRFVLLGVAVVLLAVLYKTGGKTGLWRGLLASSLGTVGLGTVFALLAATNFTEAFYKFHELFFTNDLWLLDPATDRLIQMLPERFFLSITLHILVLTAEIMGVMGVMAVINLKRAAFAGRR